MMLSVCKVGPMCPRGPDKGHTLPGQASSGDRVAAPLPAQPSDIATSWGYFDSKDSASRLAIAAAARSAITVNIRSPRSLVLAALAPKTVTMAA